MALVVQNGALLKQGNALASGAECCCCPANACCYWSCDYIAELVWPEIENPEDIPDVSEAMIAAGWGLVDGQWLKTIRGEENCDDPAVAAAKFQALEAEVNAIVGGQGGFSIVTAGFFLGPGCMDCATQQECEEVYLGTFHANKKCSEEPCCSGPCPNGNVDCAPGCKCVAGKCASCLPCKVRNTLNVKIESNFANSTLAGEYTLNLVRSSVSCTGGDVACVWAYDNSTPETVDCSLHVSGGVEKELWNGVRVSVEVQPGFGVFLNAVARYSAAIDENYHYRSCCLESTYGCYEGIANVKRIIWDAPHPGGFPPGYDVPANWYCDGVAFETGTKEISFWSFYPGSHWGTVRAWGA